MLTDFCCTKEQLKLDTSAEALVLKFLLKIFLINYVQDKLDIDVLYQYVLISKLRKMHKKQIKTKCGCF